MKYIISGLVIILFFSSCLDNSKSELAVFEATTKSLEQSSKAISDITADYRKQLFDKLYDLRTSQYAVAWQPKAAKVSELALSTIGYIDKLKLQLAGEVNSFEVVNKVFFQQNKGDELHQQVRSFIDIISTLDAGFNNQYAKLIGDNYDYLDSTKYDDKEFTRAFFSHVSSAAALTMLAKFENDIRNIEKQIVTYCYYRASPGCILQFETFQALIGLNSSCVKAGDEIEINAGVGSFSTAAKPNFTIDGKLIPANENGIVEYKFKTPVKAGTYSKTVKIEFYKPDGRKESMTKNLEYTVIEPK